MFKEKINFAEAEEEVMKFWRDTEAFECCQESSKSDPSFTFYDGPPFATGLPHYGHLLAGTIKDTVTRFWYQQGFKVNRRFGWDCHGLPVEYEIDKKLGINTRDEILEMGIAKYNEECRAIVMKYSGEWKHTVERMGRWVDFGGYRTMDRDFMESVWFVFKVLYSKGCVYRGYRVMPFSTACSTPVSNFEANQNYKEVSDPSVLVCFPIYETSALHKRLTTVIEAYSSQASNVDGEIDKEDAVDNKNGSGGKNNAVDSKKDTAGNKNNAVDRNDSAAGDENNVPENNVLNDCISPCNKQITPCINIVAWTTTPWTLPSHCALFVNRSFIYALFMHKSRYHIMLESRVAKYFPEAKLLCRIQGDELLGTEYHPPYRYFEYLRPRGFFRVLPTDFVSDADGTGIVHGAPGFGEEDYRAFVKCGLIRENDLVPCPVDENGCFTSEVADYRGKYVKDCDKQILRDLGERILVNRREVHRYPFCWRSDTPLLYKLVPNWFVSVTPVIPKLLRNNEAVNWVPGDIKYKKFHNWLENARDWSISRNRFWGTPIPLWVSEDYSETICVGSVEELERLSSREIGDIHREHIDDIVLHKNGKELRRIDEVFDCWFESGCMPYAQDHWPFNGEVSCGDKNGVEVFKDSAKGSDDKGSDKVSGDKSSGEIIDKGTQNNEDENINKCEATSNKHEVSINEHNIISNKREVSSNKPEVSNTVNDALPLKAGFPADFIAEGIDQTRGWFYTLHVISTLLFDKPAYMNVIVNGIVLAEDGKKMSKRLKNYPDPLHILRSYGADSLRMYLLASPVVEAENLKFSERGVKEITKTLLIPWYNSLGFYMDCVKEHKRENKQTEESSAVGDLYEGCNAVSMSVPFRFSDDILEPRVDEPRYTDDMLESRVDGLRMSDEEVDGFKHEDEAVGDNHGDIYKNYSSYAERGESCSGYTHKHTHYKKYESTNKLPMDDWIIQSLNTFKHRVSTDMKKYHLSKILSYALAFLDDLSNWYIRINRKHIRAGRSRVLGEVLEEFSVAMAPFTPFFSEYCYQSICPGETVHARRTACRPVGGSHSFDFCKRVIEGIRQIREQNGVSLKTPLKSARVILPGIVKQYSERTNDKAAGERTFVGEQKKDKQTNEQLKDKQTTEQTSKLSRTTQFSKYDFMEYSGVIKSECNLLELIFEDEEAYKFEIKAKPNFATLKKAPDQIKHKSVAISRLTDEELSSLFRGSTVSKGSVEIYPSDVILCKRLVGVPGLSATFKEFSIVVDNTVDERILEMKVSREFNSFVQKMRKMAGLRVEDLVEVYVDNRDLAMLVMRWFDIKFVFSEGVYVTEGSFLFDGREVKVGLILLK